MADYKILQNIDLAQNEIKEVSKIANDRQDGKDKGLRIQTGNDTSLVFNRKIDTSNTINSIKGTVKDGTDENKKESVLNLEPSEVRISHTKGTTSSSGFVLGLDSKGKEHIEAVSPLVDIKTGGTDYTDPHISLKKDISTLGLQSNIVEIKTSESVNVGENGEILKIVTTTPKITIPSSTATDINSKTIGLGDSGSTTTISGSEFSVETTNTNITSPTTTVSGTTTIKSSSNSENTIEVKKESTSITGNQANINPVNVNIGTVDNSTVIIGKDNANNTTTLKSSKTEITSPILNVVSPTVNFNGDGQSVNFKKNTKNTNIVTSEVPTHVKDTTFSVEKTIDSSITEVFKVDTSPNNSSTTINGKTATINSTNVNIGIATTTDITIGRNNADTTTLKSNKTRIISPTIEIGTESPSTSVSIGKDSSDVTLTGRSNFSVTATNTNSKVQANDLKFNKSLSSNDIKIRWDSALNSLVFEKA